MRIIILLIPTIALAGGFGISIFVGGNYQWYDLDISNIEAGDGFGYHLGVALEKSLTPSRLPISLSTELDLAYYHTAYSWDVAQVGQTEVLADLNLNSLYLPLCLKLNLNSPAFGFSLGAGGFMLHNFGGKGKWRIGSIILERDLEDDDLETDFGLLLKVQGSSKLAPMVFFYPSFNFRYNLTADNPDTETADESEYGIEFRFGVGIEI
ncbi:MAG TPA: hypothetical protein EYP58_01985 [bacterium (Candidatus Stahlbacteria)]|nr:hypothetical protein [Candidatus Stahlbacteria bacterium]